MLTVDFYLLESASEKNRLSITCKIAAKAFQAGTPTYIYTDNKAQAMLLDEMLWTYQETAFVPHQVATADANADVDTKALLQIMIGWEPAPANTQLIINYAQQLPEITAQCTRVIEVVSKQPEQLQISRDHYRYYQTIGAQLHSHPIAH